MTNERDTGDAPVQASVLQSEEAAPKKTQRAKRQSREAVERKSDKWTPAGLLPIPEPRDGISYRWIRTSMMDVTDTKNVSKRFREGYVPAKASEHPEFMVQSDLDARFDDSIEYGGLMLCQIPTEILERRKEYYSNLGQNQMAAVDQNYLRENDPRMRKFADRKSRTSFGSG